MIVRRRKVPPAMREKWSLISYRADRQTPTITRLVERILKIHLRTFAAAAARRGDPRGVCADFKGLWEKDWQEVLQPLLERAVSGYRTAGALLGNPKAVAALAAGAKARKPAQSVGIRFSSDEQVANHLRADIGAWLTRTSKLETAYSIKRYEELFKEGMIGKWDDKLQLWRGFNQDEMEKQILSRGLAQTRERAELMGRTLTIYATNEGAQKVYRDEGVTQQQWLATVDELTCPVCAEYDGTVVGIDDLFAAPGQTITTGEGEEWSPGIDVPHPPMHPNCRCCLVPVYSPEQIDQAIKDLEGTPDPTPEPEPEPPPPPQPAPAAAVKTMKDFLDPAIAPRDTFAPTVGPVGQKIIEDLEKLAQQRAVLEVGSSNYFEMDRKTNRWGQHDAMFKRIRRAKAPRIAITQGTIFVEGESTTAGLRPLKDSGKASLVKGKLKQSREFMNKAVSESVVPPPPPRTLPVEQIRITTEVSTRTNDCAYAHEVTPTRTRIHIHAEDSLGTYVHEIAHSLESARPELAEYAKKWIDGRALRDNNGVMTRFELYPLNPSRRNEFALKGNFIDPYVGKQYSFNATEVYSMGFQAMIDGPVEFYRKDPEHFKMILSLMTGENLGF